MYKVVQLFTDLQDNNHVYGVGDKYPRDGYDPTPERIEELATTKNRRGLVLIKKEPEKKKAEEPKKEPKPKKAPAKKTKTKEGK